MANRLFSPVDKLIDHASCLDMRLHRRGDRVAVTFELSGTLGKFNDDDEIEQEADMRLVRELLARFEEGGAT